MYVRRCSVYIILWNRTHWTHIRNSPCNWNWSASLNVPKCELMAAVAAIRLYISGYVYQCNTGPISIHCGVATTTIPLSVPHTIVPYHNIALELGGDPRHHWSVTFTPIHNWYTCWRTRCCSKGRFQCEGQPVYRDYALLAVIKLIMKCTASITLSHVTWNHKCWASLWRQSGCDRLATWRDPSTTSTFRE